MIEATLTIVNKLGLHARAAGKLVNLTKTFSSRVMLCRPEAGDAEARENARRNERSKGHVDATSLQVAQPLRHRALEAR